ncbi:thermonuclease family protein [Jannaschia pohangensis]|uniref:Endonuclease YncB, thermonuclease family n=1 Tax=Jannaschia pohangensis TaxID=390807 RepID=A0A1I3IMB7_9RHOB|nr:thermonuclease family protein [Jannaschia pohangensis]SFI49118.1 Endonuclease YncB, thermonuclease family [Jannaschia pohangensis]
MFRLCSLLLLIAFPVGAQTLTGTIRVVDADTIDIGAAANIRLIGIDAAEGDQTCRDTDGTILPCGSFATEAARRMYEGRIARCEVDSTDRYGRALATCFVDGVDMNGELVRLGIARRYREGPAYFDEEKEARVLARGLWAYEMVDPAVWRAEGRARRAAANAPAGDCTIKGNISDSGRIYHLSGSRAYGATRIDENRGERWFCSEAEARAAGWRPVR